MNRIYLDHAATTPLLPAVREAMLSCLDSGFGNPSSLHADGHAAKQVLDEAREAYATALGCLFSEVTFCSSATEAANLALTGLALHAWETGLSGRRKILMTAAEHPCVLACTKPLSRMGFEVEVLPVNRDSTLSLDGLASALSDEVLAVAVIHTNNETGAVNPVAKVVEMARAVGAVTVCDAVQASASEWNCGADLVFVAPHKFGGAKGCGVLACQYPAMLEPLIYGGGQERELRGGTENVAAIAGAFAALKGFDFEAVRKLQWECASAFVAGLASGVASVPAAQEMQPGILNLRFPGVDAESLLIRLDRAGISASMGAACSAGSQEPSHVLMACGLSEGEARECVRFSFGWNSSVEESVRAAELVKRSLT